MARQCVRTRDLRRARDGGTAACMAKSIERMEFRPLVAGDMEGGAGVLATHTGGSAHEHTGPVENAAVRGEATELAAHIDNKRDWEHRCEVGIRGGRERATAWIGQWGRAVPRAPPGEGMCRGMCRACTRGDALRSFSLGGSDARRGTAKGGAFTRRTSAMKRREGEGGDLGAMETVDQVGMCTKRKRSCEAVPPRGASEPDAERGGRSGSIKWGVGRAGGGGKGGERPARVPGRVLFFAWTGKGAVPRPARTQRGTEMRTKKIIGRSRLGSKVRSGDRGEGMHRGWAISSGARIRKTISQMIRAEAGIVGAVWPLVPRARCDHAGPMQATRSAGAAGNVASGVVSSQEAVRTPGVSKISDGHVRRYHGKRGSGGLGRPREVCCGAFV